MSEIKAPILIIGCRRSGTSLLRTLLSQHSQFAVHPDEPQFIIGLAQRFGETNIPADRAITYITTHRLCPTEVTAEILSARIGSQQTISLQEIVHTYLDLWQSESAQLGRVVLKDPYFSFHLPQMKRLFPDATWIHIVRDPRANVSSQRSRWPSANVYECARWWRDTVTASHALCVQEKNSAIEIAYEALINEPQQTLEQLCKHLTVPYEDSFFSFKHETRMFDAGEGQPRSFSHFDPTRLSLWKKRLTDADIQLVETICSPTMQSFGYSKTTAGANNRFFIVFKIRQWIEYQSLRTGRYAKHLLRQIGLLHYPSSS